MEVGRFFYGMEGKGNLVKVGNRINYFNLIIIF